MALRRLIVMALLLGAASSFARADFNQTTFAASIWARSNYNGPPFPPPQWNGGDFTGFGPEFNNSASSSMLGVTAQAQLNASHSLNTVSVIAATNANSSVFSWQTWAEGDSAFTSEYVVPPGGRWRVTGQIGPGSMISFVDLRGPSPQFFGNIGPGSGPQSPVDASSQVFPLGGRFSVTFLSHVRWDQVGQPPLSDSMNIQMTIIPPPPPPPPESCDGDADGNNAVNFQDITSVLANFNSVYTVSNGAGDADHNMVVKFGDITRVLSRFNTVCR